MASSMTGLGLGDVIRNGMTLTVELRSVNNRFLEISCRIPSVLSAYEKDVRELIRSTIHRGKVYITVSIQGDSDGVLDIRVDQKMAKSLHRLLEDLKRETGIDEDLKLDHFLKFSEVFEPQGTIEQSEEMWEWVQEALSMALADLKKMRDQEGSGLVQDILGRVSKLEAHVDAVERIAKTSIPEAHNKLLERVRVLTKEIHVDEDRLNAEIVLMADRMDVTEECVRLRSHHRLFRKILDEECVTGKKLNFLLQEMNRETNTISSKVANVEISHIVVEMKEEIEKLREQVQNLE